ncbi:MAG: hypothetical protein KDA53_06100 [Hyphomonas sp.]|nr:hypothetical protein [Hyphomonas sp.]
MSEGETGIQTDTATPSYAGAIERRRRFKRIKLGLFLSSLAACLGVTLLGLLSSGLVSLAFGLTGRSSYVYFNEHSFVNGMMMGCQLATYNFFLFFITVPAAWLALGLSIGRMPYRGIVKMRPFLRWGAIWGAILVGGMTGGFGLFSGPVNAAGALLTGGMIGAVAGVACGLLFHRIVRPAEQLADVDVNVF